MATPANDFAFASLVSNTILAEFNMQMAFLATGNRTLQEDFMQDYYRPGQTVPVRLRNKFIVGQGDTVTTQGIIEETDNVTVQPFYNVAVDFSTFDSTLKMTDYNQRYIRSMVNELIGKVERDIGTAAKTQIWQATGTPGSPINSFAAVDGAATFLIERDIPTTPLNLALRPRDASALKSALQNAFNATLNENISFGSRLGSLSFTDVFMTNGVATQTNGTMTSATVNGAVASGSSIIYDGANTATATITAGTVISIAGVNSVTNIGRADTGQAMQFVVQQNVTSVSNAGTLSVLPAIISDSTNPQRNVTNAIPDNAVITVIASHNDNVLYHESGLSVVTLPAAPLATPFCAIEHDEETGIWLRTSVGADILNNLNIMRVDLLVAYKWHGQYCVRVMS